MTVKDEFYDQFQLVLHFSQRAIFYVKSVGVFETFE